MKIGILGIVLAAIALIIVMMALGGQRPEHRIAIYNTIVSQINDGQLGRYAIQPDNYESVSLSMFPGGLTADNRVQVQWNAAGTRVERALFATSVGRGRNFSGYLYVATRDSVVSGTVVQIGNSPMMGVKKSQ